ncbi:MAG: hypothetical protein V2A66_06080, partial [Pseudomonadota bacterium]
PEELTACQAIYPACPVEPPFSEPCCYAGITVTSTCFDAAGNPLLTCDGAIFGDTYDAEADHGYSACFEAPKFEWIDTNGDGVAENVQTIFMSDCPLDQMKAMSVDQITYITTVGAVAAMASVDISRTFVDSGKLLSESDGTAIPLRRLLDVSLDKAEAEFREAE